MIDFLFLVILFGNSNIYFKIHEYYIIIYFDNQIVFFFCSYIMDNDGVKILGATQILKNSPLKKRRNPLQYNR